MTLWGGRFSGKMDEKAWAFNSSLVFDQRLAQQDIRGSIAWAQALHSAGVLNQIETDHILDGLSKISLEFSQGTFTFSMSDEDIHTAVERRLGELIGSDAGKLHTGRSRNDQVATDFRLWLLDQLPTLKTALRDFQTVLVKLAEDHVLTLMPGYTHLQRAQPISFAHWLLSHFWAVQRDCERFQDIQARVAVLPLGCGALAGTSFPIDRTALALALGFNAPAPNSLDAVSDRDFAAEFLFNAALTGVHLSRLAEGIILFSTTEFGFIQLSDSFSTGSSLMPQKKNPDVFELTRGKAGTLTGLLTGMLATLKGLPSSYDKDLQEDKAPVFQAMDTLLQTLSVISGALSSMTVNTSKMKAAIDPAMLATDLADTLVLKGLPFREAHAAAGKAVRLAEQKQVSLTALSPKDWQTLGIDPDEIPAIFDPTLSIQKRNAFGGTAPEAVQTQIQFAKTYLSK